MPGDENAPKTLPADFDFENAPKTLPPEYVYSTTVTAPKPPGFWGRLYQGTIEPVWNIARHPLEAPGAMAKAIWAQPGIRGNQAIQAFKEGKIPEGIVRSLEAVPLFGGIGDVSEQMIKDWEEGNKLGALGTATSLALPFLFKGAGAAAKAAGIEVPLMPAWGQRAEANAEAAQASPGVVSAPGQIPIPAATMPNPHAKELASLEYLQSEGVPVSAADLSGSRYLQALQKASDYTPFGSGVALRTERQAAQATRALSERLAEQAHPSPVVPQQAGEGVRSGVQQAVEGYGANAQTSYDAFRSIEDLPSSAREVQVGTRRSANARAALDEEALKQFGQGYGGLDFAQKQAVENAVEQAGVSLKPEPVFETVKMPVNVTSIKDMVRPIYQEMMQWWEPARRNASAGFTAIKSILEGPDVVPASIAESGLGGLKELAREGAGRNSGLAKLVVPKLQEAIDYAVEKVDPHALVELKSGREQTALQYGAKGVLDQLRTEPVQTFGQMTYAKDAGINLLKDVAREAPGTLPQIGRAWLEDLFAKAGAEGKWQNAASLWAKWRDLGPETKKLLFPHPGLQDSLDKFFQGTKRLAENPNPSGTALMHVALTSAGLIWNNPLTGIPMVLGGGLLSKLLRTPAGAAAINNGIQMQLSTAATAAQRTAATMRVIRLLERSQETPPRTTSENQSDPVTLAQGLAQAGFDRAAATRFSPQQWQQFGVPPNRVSQVLSAMQ